MTRRGFFAGIAGLAGAASAPAASPLAGMAAAPRDILAGLRFHKQAFALIYPPLMRPLLPLARVVVSTPTPRAGGAVQEIYEGGRLVAVAFIPPRP